mmetsp:Transcript_54362/g.96652  ORF Transcript_54362/g.96652 Transcript_54362/m.96652 type:complete len:117 (-) Transcript_54362:1021-1371(-)
MKEGTLWGKQGWGPGPANFTHVTNGRRADKSQVREAVRLTPTQRTSFKEKPCGPACKTGISLLLGGVGLHLLSRPRETTLYSWYQVAPNVEPVFGPVAPTPRSCLPATPPGRTCRR